MTEKQQINLTLLHVGIGALLAFSPRLSKIYVPLIVLIGLYFVIKNKNKNNEILYVIAYIAGSEVFFRTTNGNVIHEFGKYAMVFFTFLGFFYSGFPKIKNPYWLYLLLLLPAMLISFLYLDGNWRVKISFEILGPICLGVLALYTYRRQISAAGISMILNLIALPIFASCIFLIINYSQTAYNVTSTSNYYFSGNYAPNQMATALGLGVFIYLLKIIIESDSKRIFFLNTIIFCLLFYRGLLTFSRGGIATALVVILTLFLAIYISKSGYFRLKRKIGLLVFILTSIFILTAYQTESSLFTRYKNIELLDSGNVIKKRGRYIQVKSDIENFTENPLLGVGVGKSKEIRIERYKKKLSTHTEVTRLLSEHGVLGLCALLILLFFPLRLYFNDLRNFYLLPFFIFWLLSINHSATRIVAPLFLYALTLLHIRPEKEEGFLVRE
jgi:hypothetical protein